MSPTSSPAGAPAPSTTIPIHRSASFEARLSEYHSTSTNVQTEHQRCQDTPPALSLRRSSKPASVAGQLVGDAPDRWTDDVGGHDEAEAPENAPAPSQADTPANPTKPRREDRTSSPRRAPQRTQQYLPWQTFPASSSLLEETIGQGRWATWAAARGQNVQSHGDDDDDDDDDEEEGATTSAAAPSRSGRRYEEEANPEGVTRPMPILSRATQRTVLRTYEYGSTTEFRHSQTRGGRRLPRLDQEGASLTSSVPEFEGLRERQEQQERPDGCVGCLRWTGKVLGVLGAGGLIVTCGLGLFWWVWWGWRDG
ncbi:MAG: hypothetical protein M1831_004315 [Alyxoria varia]|nr:MAG: hypothetical protein M1831_004315 [Alyxoria varia]